MPVRIFNTVNTYSAGPINAARGEMLLIDLNVAGGDVLVNFPAGLVVGEPIGVQVSDSAADRHVVFGGVSAQPIELSLAGDCGLWTWSGASWVKVDQFSARGSSLFRYVYGGGAIQMTLGDYVVSSDSIPQTITLPVVSASTPAGVYCAVRNSFGNVITLAGGTVNGQPDHQVRAAGESLFLVYSGAGDGDTWNVLSSFDPPRIDATDIYVATTGLDTNPGTIAAPKLTLGGAYAVLPYQQAASFTVHLASGTYAYEPPPACVQSDLDAMIVLVGDGAGQGGDDGFTVVATGTVGVGSTSTSIVIQVPVVADAYQRLTIEFTSGVAIGVRRQITTNTTTVLSLNWPSENTAGALVPANGDTFRIVRPAVVLTGTVDTLGYIDGGSNNGLHLVNVALTSATAAAIWQFGELGPHLFYGVELQNQCSLTVTGQIVAGAGYNAGPTVLVRRLQDLLFTAIGQTVGQKQWYGWGLTTFTAGGVLVNLEAASYFGGFACGGGSLNVNGDGSFCELFGGFVNNIAVGAPANFAARNTTAALLISNAAITAREPVNALGRASFDGAVTILLAGASTAGFFCRGSSVVIVTGNLSITSTTSNQPTLQTTDAAIARFVGTVTTNTSTGSGFMSSRSATVSFEGAVSLTQAAGGNVSRTSRVNATNFAMIGGAFTVNGNGTFTVSGVFSLTNGNSAGGALQVAQQGVCSLGGACTIANTSVTAGADGVRVQGGSLYFAANPTITMAAASGYAVNARGGGKVLCALQPSNAVGATADFSIGSGVGEDFPDTDLAASLSYKVAGAASVARTT